MSKLITLTNLGKFLEKIRGIFVAKEAGKGLSTNDYTTEEKNKLAGIAENANKYTHPSYDQKESGLYKITVDATGHVSETSAVEKTDITGLGIPGQDTTYTAFKGATASAAGGTGLVPPPAAGKQGQFLKGDGTWATPPNTTYSKANASADGLMSKEDYSKLAGFGAASTYALKSDVAGGIKYKGTIENDEALPSSPEQGDMYNIAASETYGDGMNVIWNGTDWDPQAPIITIEEATDLDIDNLFTA